MIPAQILKDIRDESFQNTRTSILPLFRILIGFNFKNNKGLIWNTDFAV